MDGQDLRLTLAKPAKFAKRTQNPEPRTQNPEPRTQNPEPRTQNPEPRTQELKEEGKIIVILIVIEQKKHGWTG